MRVSIQTTCSITKKDGTTVLLPYDDVGGSPIDVFGNYFLVKKKEGYSTKLGLIDSEGRELIPPIYESIETILFQHNLFIIREGDHYGIFDIEKGMVVVKPRYDDIEVCRYDFPEYDYIGSHFDVCIDSPKEMRNYEILITKIDGLYGFYNAKENIEIEPAYDVIKPFHNNTAPVKRGDKWGLINSKGLLEKKITAKFIIIYRGYFYLAFFENSQSVWDYKGNPILSDGVEINGMDIYVNVYHSDKNAETTVQLFPEYVDGKITINSKILYTYQRKEIPLTSSMKKKVMEKLNKIANK